ncbi:type II secretion system F family protein [Pararhizobium sp. IMCC21322]|uniref:type II secretion system F family protein n=1 Tax=Pararhizobium sp. IMCC21322 TaxID=3067903 RepID=UPI002741980D|nr:type II secretion system F family protein [Pararhizobium sp. IMCC21322]
MSIYLVYFAVFVCVLVATDTILRTVRNRLQRRSYMNHRLSLIEQDADRNAVYRNLLKERGIDAEDQQSFSNYLNKLYIQSGLRLSFTRITSYLGLVAAFCYLGLAYLGYGGLLGIAIAAMLAAAVALAFVFRAKASRVKKFTAQLPEAIDIIIRSLSAGHPLPISISLVARETKDPIGSEFGILSDELTYGVDVDVGIRNMAARVGAEELNLLAISLSVQKGSGGNLGEILTNLADMIRKRVMMKSKIKAISAEGRMTAWFMLGFPFFLYGIIRLLNADYFTPLWESGYGTHFLVVSGVLLTVGMLVIRKIINFDY